MYVSHISTWPVVGIQSTWVIKQYSFLIFPLTLQVHVQPRRFHSVNPPSIRRHSRVDVGGE